VVNPANGPGAAATAAYSGGIAKLAGAGVRVIGYVYTGYGKRPAADVQADIDRWKRFYPQVSGIFFDEMAYAAGAESYYRQQSAYARAAGATFTVGNPGVDTIPSYVGAVDLILVYESAGPPAVERMGGWHANYDRLTWGVIPYGMPACDTAFVATAKAHVGYIYTQSDTLPNPWDSLPAYFPALLAALE